MLRSYISFAAGGDVVLRSEVAMQLGVGHSGVLYGSLFPPENTLLLSPIPPEAWQRAFKIIVYTHHKPGSLAAVARKIANRGLDTISSWASSSSFRGHLCSTSIVVAAEKRQDAKFSREVEEELREELDEHLSDLPIFGPGKLVRVRVTPLNFLATYSREMPKSHFQRVSIRDHSLRLGHNEKSDESPLWDQLLTACLAKKAFTCILTPNTEEALLRVGIFPETARLTRFIFRLGIESRAGTFAGYWTEALDKLKEYDHSVHVAHNLLISKTTGKDKSEEAEFCIVTDRGWSPDTGESLQALETKWKRRFQVSLGTFASSRKGKATVSDLSVSRPRGVGVPCFFACDALPGDCVGLSAARQLCLRLEGKGFLPLNVDLASGEESLPDQILELLKACEFMVVLRCPRPGRRNSETGMHEPSDWVGFEEAAMARQGGKITRYRFSTVRKPAFIGNRYEIELSEEEGISLAQLDDFAARIDRWLQDFGCDGGLSMPTATVPDKYLDRDLVAVYGNGIRHP